MAVYEYEIHFMLILNITDETFYLSVIGLKSFHKRF